MRNEYVKTEIEEFQSVDEQVILSKTKFTKIKQYNPKKPEKQGFKNQVCSAFSSFIYDFYLYSGKGNTGDNASYNHLQKSGQLVKKLMLRFKWS